MNFSICFCKWHQHSLTQAFKFGSIFDSLFARGPLNPVSHQFLLMIALESLFTRSLPVCSHCHYLVQDLICSCLDFYNGLLTVSVSLYRAVYRVLQYAS